MGSIVYIPIDSPALLCSNSPQEARRPMELFSPDRPKLGNGLPVLLLDGSAVPMLTVMPNEDGNTAHVSVMLRNPSTNESFSYRYYETDIELAKLGMLFVNYKADPELTIEYYFGWKPQLRKEVLRHSKPDRKPAVVSAQVQDMMDLLP